MRRGRRDRPGERWAERTLAVVSLTAVVMILLIFLFVAREALPVVLGQTDSAAIREIIPAERLDALSPGEVRRYLGLSRREFAALDRATLRLLMEIKEEAAAEAPRDPDATLNTTAWRYLLLPYRWSGYDRPAYIWQPISAVHKYNLVPLLVGSLKTTAVALAVAVPLALAAALFVSQLCPSRWRECLKPAIELLAGVPSVVLGFFALMVMASVLQGLFGYATRLNAFVAGLALGFATIPLVFSIAEDALTSVPRSYAEAALALGSTRWQTAWQVMLPAALPGVFAAVLLGLGRCLGETMIVLMASGNASIMSWSLFDSTRTITATIAAELAEAVFGGHHYRVLFLLGTLLFLVTFLANFVADLVLHRLKTRWQSPS